MRNGPDPSDRGNAILASAAFGPAWAFTLPRFRQRRVVIAAELLGLPGIRFVSAHLDTPGLPDLRGIRSRPAGRVAQAAGLARWLEDAPAVVVGGDLNTPFGGRDRAIAAFERRGFRRVRPDRRWAPTFAAGVPLQLDHVLYRCTGGEIARVRLRRVDREAGARSGPVHGSDHFPLLARVELRPAGQR